MSNGFWNAATEVLGRRAPKTPMAFYMRFLFVPLAGILGPTYSSIDGTAKLWFLGLALFLGFADFVWVAILTWCRPENLLYGADTHFEKWKMAYGTEQGFAGRAELKNVSVNLRGGLGARIELLPCVF